MTEHTICVVVNGEQRTDVVPARLLLSDYLRHRVGLTGTRVGCEQGVCGACTVHIDGLPVRSCLTFAVQADSHAVRTVEGLADPDGGRLHAIQDAFHRHRALQCGFCTAGFLMSVDHLLPSLSGASRDQIREALSGNICRCTGYQPIVDAVSDCVSSQDHRTAEREDPSSHE